MLARSLAGAMGGNGSWTLQNDHSASQVGAGKMLESREIIIVVNHSERAVYREIYRVDEETAIL